MVMIDGGKCGAFENMFCNGINFACVDIFDFVTDDTDKMMMIVATV